MNFQIHGKLLLIATAHAGGTPKKDEGQYSIISISFIKPRNSNCRRWNRFSLFLITLSQSMLFLLILAF